MQVMIAESYGGSDEPVDTLTRGFVDISVQVTTDPLRIKETPTEKTYQVSGHVDSSETLAQKLAVFSEDSSSALWTLWSL